MTESTTHFGHKTVKSADKQGLVDEVFHNVADRYDVMNDFMSLGSHRVFKRMLLQMSGARPGHVVLDLAGGTGDVSALFADVVGPEGQVVLTDPNDAMLKVGRERLWNRGITNVTFCQAPGEALPFPDEAFNVACISFGLRNFTDKDRALSEILRCLRPGAPLLVLEFSKPEHPALKTAYGLFQRLWPIAGQALVGNSEPYQYLIESIEMHPNQRALKQMFEDAGFIDCEYHNLLNGIAAIHRGVKP